MRTLLILAGLLSISTVAWAAAPPLFLWSIKVDDVAYQVERGELFNLPMKNGWRCLYKLDDDTPGQEAVILQCAKGDALVKTFTTCWSQSGHGAYSVTATQVGGRGGVGDQSITVTCRPR